MKQKKQIITAIIASTLPLMVNAQADIKGDDNSEGCISGDCENGYGVIEFETGDRYFGFFSEGECEGQGTYIFHEGDVYMGQFHQGAFSGEGTYTWADGTKFIGQWQNGKPHGIGTQYETDGTSETDLYNEGEVIEDALDKTTGCINGNCKNGFSVYIDSDKTRIIGMFKYGQLNGQGKIIKANGVYITGEFKDGKLNGYGKVVKPDGKETIGLWEDGKYIGDISNHYGCISGDCENGYGIYVDDEGSMFAGDWLNGQPHGLITQTDVDGSVTEATYVNGKITGMGRMYLKNDPDIKSYCGEIKNGYITGKGTIAFTDGSVYFGDFIEGVPNGKGVFVDNDGSRQSGIYRNGDFTGEQIPETKIGCIFGNCINGYGSKLTEIGTFYGNFENGKPNGKGMVRLLDGGEYVGDFVNGKMEGQGTLKNAEGRTFIGSFKNNKFTGEGTTVDEDGSKSNTDSNGNEVVDNNVAKPEVSWTTPQYYNTEQTEQKTNIKLCVTSKVPIESVRIYVNGEIKVKNATRGFSVVTSKCDFSYDFEVDLEPGQNELYAEVTNAGGTTKSDPRYITLNSSDDVSNDKRIALIIGNGAYQNVSALPNPPNDAKLMGETLQKLGFETMTYTDLDYRTMIERIRDFGTKLTDTKAVGLFFYAGHGLQVNGDNYLVPVNANIQKQQDVELETVNLQRVLGEMEYAANDLNIIILDACRNNPFANARAIGDNGGLAQVNAPKGTFIAYATSPGKVASDGERNNGLYTEQLVKHLTTPGQKLEDVFKHVRNDVYQESNHQQIPWENSSIFGDFYFKK